MLELFGELCIKFNVFRISKLKNEPIQEKTLDQHFEGKINYYGCPSKNPHQNIASGEF